VVVVFPFSMSFGWHGRWTIIAIASSGFSRYQSRRGRWSSTGNTAIGRSIGVVLIRTLIAMARRTCSVLHKGSNFQRWAGRANVSWDDSLARAWVCRTPEPSGRRRRGWRHTGGMWTVVGIGDTVRLRWLRLLLMKRWLWLSLGRL